MTKQIPSSPESHGRSRVCLEIDDAALGEGLPGSDRVLQAALGILGRHFAQDLEESGSVAGRITRSSTEPPSYELTALFLSGHSYSATEHRIRFTIDRGACTLISFE